MSRMDRLVVVLNDGETFTLLKGCRIVEIPDYVVDDEMDAYVKEHFVEGKLLIEHLIDCSL